MAVFELKSSLVMTTTLNAEWRKKQPVALMTAGAEGRLTVCLPHNGRKDQAHPSIGNSELLRLVRDVAMHDLWFCTALAEVVAEAQAAQAPLLAASSERVP